MDSEITFALILGSGLGWGVWSWQRVGKTVEQRILKGVRQRVNGWLLPQNQKRLMMAIASGGAMALSTYGSLMLWDNFHNGWLVAGMVGQSGLTLALALAWLNRERQGRQDQEIERFHRLLEHLLRFPVEQRPVVIQQLLWLGLKGRLDAYQQSMVLQTFQGLFMTARDDAEKADLSQAIAQFQQFQTLSRTGRASYALGSSSLGQVEMPLAYIPERQSETITARPPLRPVKPQKNSPTNPS